LGLAVGAPALHKALLALKQSEEGSAVFLESFLAILDEHCNYGYDDVLSEERADRLADYFAVNCLLLECLDLAHVSNRQAIEDSLLLPPGMW
jgi:hypothetical protein